MPRMIKRGDRIMIEDHAIGDYRDATRDEIMRANIDLPDALANSVAAASTGETFDPSTGALNPFRRLHIINFASSPDARRATLDGLGYDVTDVDGMQWAKLKGTKAWRPVDPAMGKGGFWEPTLDMFDLTTDAIKGFLSTAAAVAGGVAGGAVGGPPGAVAGAMAAGGAVQGLGEKVRQEVGSATGIKNNIDNQAAITEGAIAAPMSIMPAAPVKIPTGGIVPELRTLMTPVKEGALSLSAKIAGTRPDLLSLRGQIKGFGKLPTGRKAAMELKKVFEDFESGRVRIPARDAADKIVAEADKNGQAVNLEPMFEKMREFVLAEGGEAKTAAAAKAKTYDPNLPNTIKRLYANLQEFVDLSGHRASKMPASAAEEVKRMMQGIADNKGAYGEFDVTDQVADKIGDFGKIARRQLEEVLDATGVVDEKTGKNYSQLMSDVSEAMGWVGKVRRGFWSGQDDVQKVGRAVRTMKGLFGETGHELLDAVAMMDDRLGTNVYETVRQAALGKSMGETFGQFGKPNIIPRFTAQGRPLGANFAGGAGQYLPAAGLLGAGAAAGAPLATGLGLAYASPLAQLALVKAAQKAPALAQGTQAILASPQTKRGLLTAASAIGSRQ